VADTGRAVFAKHPWSIGGGGAADVKEAIEDQATSKLSQLIESAGFMAIAGEDDAFVFPRYLALRLGIPVRDFALGDQVRDWTVDTESLVAFPYVRVGHEFKPAPILASSLYRRLSWCNRTVLRARVMFGKSPEEHGNRWDQYMQFIKSRVAADYLIGFAEVATHNHFILDRGGKVFKQTAPVLKLSTGASEEEHLGLLGLLNSSVVCFWMKQVSHQKQMMGGDGIRISEKAKVPYQFASTRLLELPLPKNWRSHSLKPRLTDLASEADQLARSMFEPSAAQVIERAFASRQSIAAMWRETLAARQSARSRLIVVQEEIDFVCYIMYGLTDDPGLLSPSTNWDVAVEAGTRPFCILSQLNVDGFPVPEGIPSEWPTELRSLWSRRMRAIKESAALGTIEEPHYKRRWIGRQGLFNHGARANELADALGDWMLARLESQDLWAPSVEQAPQLNTTHRLADSLQSDAQFAQVAALYTGRADYALPELVAKLVASEAVPFLPVLRYADTGLRKRAQWEEIWALQRREDEGEAMGKIPVPPKYVGKDFLRSDYWRLRGGLDVPKERWVSYPGCERGADGSLVVAWAGWDHLQQATALATYFIDMKEREGWNRERLQPLLAGLLELVPWLKQWHNDMSPDFGARMGDYYESFVNDEARALQFTLDDLSAWTPPATSAKRGRKKTA
jgi:hypothetical protein